MRLTWGAEVGKAKATALEVSKLCCKPNFSRVISRVSSPTFSARESVVYVHSEREEVQEGVSPLGQGEARRGTEGPPSSEEARARAQRRIRPSKWMASCWRASCQFAMGIDQLRLARSRAR